MKVGSCSIRYDCFWPLSSNIASPHTRGGLWNDTIFRDTWINGVHHGEFAATEFNYSPVLRSLLEFFWIFDDKLYLLKVYSIDESVPWKGSDDGHSVLFEHDHIAYWAVHRLKALLSLSGPRFIWSVEYLPYSVLCHLIVNFLCETTIEDLKLAWIENYYE